MDLARWTTWLKTPPWALACVAWLASVLVQTGAFGTVDTTRRYQVTRALWRAEPPVHAGDFPGYGLLASDGHVHAWYGIGQSLVMLPADLAAGAVTSLLGLRDPLRLKIEAGLVAYATFPALAALSAMLAYTLLRRLGGFAARPAALGVLAWLLTTTVLPYSQTHFENSLDLCLGLSLGVGTFHWAQGGGRATLVALGLATGLMVLTRLTSLADAVVLVCGSLFAAYVTVPVERRAWLRARLAELACLWVPLVVLSVVLDRAYHIARFGWDEAFGTYIHLFGAQERAKNPALPLDYPFSGSFMEGFLGPLVSVNRSMFLFDPLALAGAVLFVWAAVTRRLGKPVAVLLVACLLCLFGRLVVYARYAHWDGSTSWSNRFTLMPFQLALLFVVPTFLTLHEHVGRISRFAFGVFVALGASMALCGVLVNPDLEIIQANCDHGRVVLIPNRAANVARELFGVDPDGLSRGGCVPEEFRRLNLLPWGNARDLPAGAQLPALVAWLVLFAFWCAAVVNVLRLGQRSKASGARPS